MSLAVKVDGVWVPAAGSVSYSYAPIGAIFPFGGTSAPSGYLMCDGSAVSRTDYSALFAVIGTSFGAGDGSTTFNVPDLREATTKGVGLSGKSSNHYDSDGVALGEFIDDRFQGHWHNIMDSASSEGGGTNRGRLGNTNSTGNDSFVRQPVTDGTNGTPRTGATTEVKAVGVNYIIKSKDVNLSGGGQALADRVETLETLASDVIPSEASASNQLATENDIPDISGKQDKITVSYNASTLSDSTIITGVSAVGENPTAIQGHPLNKFWTYISGKLTGAVSTIEDRNLTPNRVLISDSSGKVGVSSITTTLLECLSGLTGNIQTQLTALGVGILKHSTSETDTGMTWTYSQNIYRRVIAVSSLANGTLATITANLNIICIRGTVYYNGYYYNIDAPTSSAASTFFVDIRYEKSTGKIDCNIQGPFSGSPANIIIEYYKS